MSFRSYVEKCLNWFTAIKNDYKSFRLTNHYASGRYLKAAKLLTNFQDYQSIKLDAYPILFTAVEQNNKDAFATIFKNVTYQEDIRIDDSNQLNVNLLMYAYLEKKFEMADLLEDLEFLPACINSKGQNILHLACLYQNVEAFMRAISKKVDMNQPDLTHNTPFHYASRAGVPELITAFILGKAKHLMNKNFEYPIHLAIDSQNIHSIGLFKDQFDADYPHFHPIHSAARAGVLSFIQDRLEANPLLINRTDDLGMTPLHYAVAYEQIRTVKYLLMFPGVLNSKQDSQGNTPLHIAFVKEHIELVQLLVQHHADLDIQNNDALAPVDYGVSGDSQAIRKYLKGIKNQSKRLDDWKIYRS